jgi:exonuclease III
MNRASLLAALAALALLPARAQASEVVRVATYNVLSLEEGTASYDALVDVVHRMAPDVLCVQELWLENGDLNDVGQFASDIGLPFHVTAGSGGSSSSQRVATFSRWPICESESWTPEEISGDSQANDLTRDILEVRISVPAVCGPPAGQCCGNLVVVNCHLKAGSFNAIDRFRRAVEFTYRLLPVLENAMNTCPGAVIISAGDFNESTLVGGSPVVWSSQPSGAPSSYDLGNDVALPFTYDPDVQLANLGGPSTFRVVDASREDSPGSKGTFINGGSRLDYIWASLGPGSASLATPPGTTEPINAAEVYASPVDNGVDDGFFGDLARKYGNGPLPISASSSASDHYPVFADLILDGCDAQRIGAGTPGQYELMPVAGYQGTPLSGSIASIRVEQARPGQVAFLFAGAPLWPGFGTTPLSIDSLAPGLIPGGFAYTSGVASLAPFATATVGSNGEASVFAFIPPGLTGFTISAQWLVADPDALGGVGALSDALVFTL